MSLSARRSGLNVSVFTLDGTSLLCELEDATVSVEVQDEDGRGVCDEWSYAFSISRAWTIEANLFVAAAGALGVADAAGSNSVAVVFNTGANTYTGNGVITQSQHSVSKGALQKYSITIKGYGALTVTAPS